jgi:predicted dehydrogenase
VSKTYKTGIVGSGFGTKAHLPALLAHPRFEVIALASPHTAVQVAAERRIPHAFASCAEMVAGVELDAVVVASPPFAHRDDVLAALERGLHVLCEKPFALNISQAEEMLAASGRAGTACGVAHEFRWVPPRMAQKELVVNGHLAPLREIEITQLAGWLRPDGRRERGWWFERSKGGGIAGALGSHLIDTASWLAGRSPVRTLGTLRTAVPQRTDPSGMFTSDVDDGMFALVDYGEGLIARITVDATCAVDQVTVAVHGESRTAIASGTSLVEMRLFSVDAEETNELLCKPSRYEKLVSVQPNVPYLMNLYDAWIAKLETKSGDELPSFEEALATQRVLEAIGYSA